MAEYSICSYRDIPDNTGIEKRTCDLPKSSSFRQKIEIESDFENPENVSKNASFSGFLVMSISEYFV